MKRHFTLALLALLVSFASFATISGTPGCCIGGTRVLTGDSMAAAGTWSSSNTAVATVTAGPATYTTVTGASAGTATISYMVGTTLSTIVFTVSAAPAAITGITSFCAGSSTTLSDATSGGTWSASWPFAVTSAGVVTSSSASTGTVYYTIWSGCSASIAVTATSPFVDSITGPSTVCVGSSMTLADITTGGTWSSANPAIATVGASTGIVSGLSAGWVNITYSVTSGGCTGYRARYINVSGAASAGTISGTLSTVAGSTTALYSTVSGGTWSSGTISVATIGATTGIVTGLVAGTTTITYTAASCGSTATATAVVTVTPFTGISGNVIFSTPYYGSLKVWLIKYNATTLMLSAADSVTMYVSGTNPYYQFTGMGTDSFRVKAAIFDTIGTSTGFIPTYHSSSFYWHSATVIYHTSGVGDINKDINMLTGTPTTGPGFIAGSVTTGANKGTSGGVPVQGLRMVAVNAASSSVMQTVRTDATGNYTFSNLPVGATYYVFPDSLNYLTTPYTGITLTASSPSKSAADFIQHTLSLTITPVLTSVNDVNAVTSVVIFPNPTGGKLNILINAATAEAARISVSDVTGREVFADNLNISRGTVVNKIDLSALNAGLYIVRIKSETVNYTSKIQVQH